MSKKSTPAKMTQKSASEIPRASRADLDRLRAAMHRAVDTSEIPEQKSGRRLQRDAQGHLPPRTSMIRTALQREMDRLDLTVYRLWQIARIHYPPLSQSGIHEFLKGRRQLELPSVEALLAAVNLHVVRKNVRNGTRARK